MKIKFHVRTLDGAFEHIECLSSYEHWNEEIEERNIDVAAEYATTDWIPHTDIHEHTEETIFGQVECFHQSDYKPGWLMDYDESELLYKITLEEE